MANVTIKLTKPIELHGKRLNEVELREPNGAMYIKHGEPRVLVFNASGSGYWVEQPDAIKAYLEALVIHDLGGDLLNVMNLEDAMGLKESMFAFFTDAAERLAARKSTASSSGSGS
jgi:hypothetical protein